MGFAPQVGGSWSRRFDPVTRPVVCVDDQGERARPVRTGSNQDGPRTSRSCRRGVMMALTQRCGGHWPTCGTLRRGRSDGRHESDETAGRCVGIAHGGVRRTLRGSIHGARRRRPEGHHPCGGDRSHVAGFELVRQAGGHGCFAVALSIQEPGCCTPVIVSLTVSESKVEGDHPVRVTLECTIGDVLRVLQPGASLTYRLASGAEFGVEGVSSQSITAEPAAV